MGMPSEAASNALIWCTYAVFLCVGCFIAWQYRHQSKEMFISSNRTQSAIPLALNFVASAMGSAILFSYPEISTIVGLQGLLTYAACSALPLMAFAFLGPILRKKLPDGFILTEWVRFRYGIVATTFIGFLTLATMFLYMIAELSALQGIINSLTGLDGLPVVIVQVVVTTIYTSLGGFKVSFMTDNIQGVMICGLVLICTIAIGTTVEIDRSLIHSSGLLNDSKLGYQLIYILFIGIITSDMFLSPLWLRTFASRSDKDLFIGVSLATVMVFIILTLVGSTGLIAVWSGIPMEGQGYIAFFLLMEKLPAWVVGMVVVMVVALSTAVFDSLQSAMVSSASTDIFRNRIPLIYIRGLVVLVIIPVIVLALKSPSVLQIYMIANLAASASIPQLFLGLSDKFFWLRGIDVTIGGLGGIFSVFLFGLVYYDGDATAASKLLILATLYAPDWSVFGVFVVAPVAGLLITFATAGIRLGVEFQLAKQSGRRFEGLDRPVEVARPSEDLVHNPAPESPSKNNFDA
ncbi:hypothetical protein DFH27DRAFT_557672 [Peziza echinospora]|nr:hypothetical protein DFH27DRAFT_557672 [Peziza echinospora]